MSKVPVYQHTLTLGETEIEVLSLTPSYNKIYPDYWEPNDPVGFIETEEEDTHGTK